MSPTKDEIRERVAEIRDDLYRLQQAEQESAEIGNGAQTTGERAFAIAANKMRDLLYLLPNHPQGDEGLREIESKLESGYAFCHPENDCEGLRSATRLEGELELEREKVATARTRRKQETTRAEANAFTSRLNRERWERAEVALRVISDEASHHLSHFEESTPLGGFAADVRRFADQGLGSDALPSTPALVEEQGADDLEAAPSSGQAEPRCRNCGRAIGQLHGPACVVSRGERPVLSEHCQREQAEPEETHEELKERLSRGETLAQKREREAAEQAEPAAVIPYEVGVRFLRHEDTLDDRALLKAALSTQPHPTNQGGK